MARLGRTQPFLVKDKPPPPFWPISATLAASSTSLTFSQSATMTGAGAIVGSSTLTFSQAGLLRGAGAVTGSSTLTFSQTGLAKGAGALVGTTSLTFSQTGAVKGAGAMVASSSLTFTPSGTLRGTAPFAGSSTITFSQSGNLKGAGAITATSSLTFTQTGSVTGSGAMSSTATLTFTISGTTTGSGAIASTSFPAFALSGTVAGSGALIGITSITFTLSSTLSSSESGTQPIQGNATLTFAASCLIESPFIGTGGGGGVFRKHFFEKHTEEHSFVPSHRYCSSEITGESILEASLSVRSNISVNVISRKNLNGAHLSAKVFSACDSTCRSVGEVTGNASTIRLMAIDLYAFQQEKIEVSARRIENPPKEIVLLFG